MNTVKVNQNLHFGGESIFVGIDVHKKQWNVCIMSAFREHKTFVQPADPEILGRYMRNNFPGATYYSAYEAGFCGFWIHEALKAEGITNIVVNPADIPTTDKEKKQKRDRIDSRKLCRELRDQSLQGIYVPNRCQLEDREIVRLRRKLVKDSTRCKNRIKSLLNFYGIEIPDKLGEPNWNKAFIEWLAQLELSYSSGTLALHVLVEELKYIHLLKNQVNRRLIGLSGDKYKDTVKLLRSIPGVGLLGALTFITELGDVSRFKNLDHLCSYVGLVPNIYGSGDIERTGPMTKRRNAYVQPILIQCAWRAAGLDPALLKAYNQLRRRMKGQKAIIRIARKLLNRIRFILLNQKLYEPKIS